MITVSIEEQSQRNVIIALTRFGDKAVKVIQDVVNRTALAIEVDGKNKLRADGHIITARLRSSIHAETVNGQKFTYSDKDGINYDGSLGEKLLPMEAVAGTNVEYAGDIEFGTGPHLIRPKNAKALKFEKDGKTIFAKWVKHPGFKGDSYMGYAAEKQRPKFPQRMETELNKLIRSEQQS